MTIDIEKKNLIISFEYNPIFIEIIKTFPDRKFVKYTKNWSVPIIHIKIVLDTLLPLGFIATKEVNFEYNCNIKYRQKINRIKSGKLKTSELKLLEQTKLPLYNYQRIGAGFLCVVGSGLLGDAPGTGKSIQSLATTIIKQSKKTLIFCPASIKQTWHEEIAKWLPHKKSVIIKGTKIQREKQWFEDKDYYICNYEILLRDLIFMQQVKWNFIIIDEATRVSNPKAKTTIALKKIKANFRLALTGTPFNNSIQDIHSILDFCQKGILGSFWQFTEQYCTKDRFNAIVGYKNLTELKEKIAPFMLRRLKSEVLHELPPKTFKTLYIEFSSLEKKMYKSVKDEIIQELKELGIKNSRNLQHILTRMVRLKQIADSTELIFKNDFISSKLDILKELLISINAKENKTIIFTQFKEMALILMRELSEYNPLLIAGNVSQEERHQNIQLFQNNNKYKVFIMTDAGSMGINLQAATSVIHYDLPWSIAKVEQREDRAHRIGQKQNLTVYKLIVEKSIDEYVLKTLYKKQQIANQILGDKDKLRKAKISKKDIQSILM